MLEQINRMFFWGDFSDTKKLHTVAWHQICKPKGAGGTGIKQLRLMNLALLAKLTWRLIQREDTLWVNILLAKYGDIWNARAQRRACTHTWRSIVATLPLVAAGTEVRTAGLSTEGVQRFELVWKDINSRKFTVASAYKMQLPEMDRRIYVPWRNIWKLKGPLRDNLLLWQARLCRLPTSDLLHSRHIRNTPTCGVCHQQQDS